MPFYDVCHSARAIYIIGQWQTGWKRPLKSLFESVALHSFVWISDLDHFGHMNNGRYLRECDLNRLDLMIRTGLWSSFDKLIERAKQNEANNRTPTASPAVSSPSTPTSAAPTKLRARIPPSEWGLVVGSIHVQYRRSLKLFDRYTITGRMIGWDTKSFFIENRYESLRKRKPDGSIEKPTIYAVLLVRVSIVGDMKTEQALRMCGYDTISPPLPKHWQHFVATSEEYRKDEKQHKQQQRVTDSKKTTDQTEQTQAGTEAATDVSKTVQSNAKVMLAPNPTAVITSHIPARL